MLWNITDTFWSIFTPFYNETKSVSTLLSPQNADIMQNMVKGDFTADLTDSILIYYENRITGYHVSNYTVAL